MDTGARRIKALRNSHNNNKLNYFTKINFLGDAKNCTVMFSISITTRGV